MDESMDLYFDLDKIRLEIRLDGVRVRVRLRLARGQLGKLGGVR
jgi:hypothetical protein